MNFVLKFLIHSILTFSTERIGKMPEIGSIYTKYRYTYVFIQQQTRFLVYSL